MSARWDSIGLDKPIAADRPCGDSLEDTALLSSIDAARVFGRSRPLDAPPDAQDLWRPPDWSEFARTALEALARSKDLRLLASLGAALLRTEGIGAFLQTLEVASSWLESYWADTYPRLDDDGDAMLRRNALNRFADPMAVIDPLRRLPLATSRQHGAISLRDVEIATGQLPVRAGDDARVDEARINAAFAEVPHEELTAFHERVQAAVHAVQRLEASMGTHAGPDAVPTLEPLSALLVRMERVVRGQLALRPGADPEPSYDVAGEPPRAAGGAPQAIGAIASRQDALRALDAVSAYFRQNEPSSPVPLFIERAKRLVAKDFLEVLADVVPEALPQVRLVGGISESES